MVRPFVGELRTIAGQLWHERLTNAWTTFCLVATIIAQLLDEGLVSAMGVTPPRLTLTVYFSSYQLCGFH